MSNGTDIRGALEHDLLLLKIFNSPFGLKQLASSQLDYLLSLGVLSHIVNIKNDALHTVSDALTLKISALTAEMNALNAKASHRVENPQQSIGTTFTERETIVNPTRHPRPAQSGGKYGLFAPKELKNSTPDGVTPARGIQQA